MIQGSVIERCNWGMPADLTLVWGKLQCTDFVQVLDYTIFKSMDHCLKEEAKCPFC